MLRQFFSMGTLTGVGDPERLVDIVGRWFAGDAAGARAAFYRAAPLIRFETQPILSLAIRKEIYRRRGAMASARVRPPVDTGSGHPRRPGRPPARLELPA
jgi:4-hydroxy-tetrahydrodipicolinate synthase